MRIVIGYAVFPAAKDDANPPERERPNRGVMRGSASALLLVVSPGPAAEPDGVDTHSWKSTGDTWDMPTDECTHWARAASDFAPLCGGGSGQNALAIAGAEARIAAVSLDSDYRKAGRYLLELP